MMISVLTTFFGAGEGLDEQHLEPTASGEAALGTCSFGRSCISASRNNNNCSAIILSASVTTFPSFDGGLHRTSHHLRTSFLGGDVGYESGGVSNGSSGGCLQLGLHDGLQAGFRDGRVVRRAERRNRVFTSFGMDRPSSEPYQGYEFTDPAAINPVPMYPTWLADKWNSTAFRASKE